MTNIFLGLYCAVLIYIIYYSSHKETTEEFLDNNKSLSASQTAWTTFASLLTGYNFVLGITFSYMYGFWFLFAFLGLLLAFVVLYFLYKNILISYQNEYYFFSIGDYFGVKFGKKIKYTVNTILCISLLLFLTLQLSVNIELLTSLLHIGPAMALALTVGIVSIYLWFGGFKASIATDIFQGMLMLPIILIIFYTDNSITTENLYKGFEVNSFVLAIGLAILQFLSLLGQAESFQRIFSVKNSSSLKRGLLFASVLLIAIAGSIAYVGVNYKIGGTSIDPSNLFTQGLLPSLPPWLQSLLTVSLIAAFMGTIDSSAFALGALLSRYKELPPKKMVQVTRLSMVIGILISSLASIYLMSFLTTVFSLISLVSIIGGSVLLLFIKQTSSTDISIYYSLSISTFIVGTIFNFTNENPITSCVPAIIGFIGLLLFKIIKYLYRQTKH